MGLDLAAADSCLNCHLSFRMRVLLPFHALSEVSIGLRLLGPLLSGGCGSSIYPGGRWKQPEQLAGTPRVLLSSWSEVSIGLRLLGPSLHAGDAGRRIFGVTLGRSAGAQRATLSTGCGIYRASVAGASLRGELRAVVSAGLAAGHGRLEPLTVTGIEAIQTDVALPQPLSPIWNALADLVDRNLARYALRDKEYSGTLPCGLPGTFNRILSHPCISTHSTTGIAFADANSTASVRGRHYGRPEIFFGTQPWFGVPTGPAPRADPEDAVGQQVAVLGRPATDQALMDALTAHGTWLAQVPAGTAVAPRGIQMALKYVFQVIEFQRKYFLVHGPSQ
ncbi:hypothetical protein BC832DRAFT_539751 [Gaertneriomyces semiglobifer]|nr:hypothetical protein BC832DRAFT_539751 [Gaertneriomyces semiglobifer]